LHRFFAPSLDPGDETVVLPKDEANHLTRVLRLGVGDTVAVFDGRGHEFAARVIATAPRQTSVQLMSSLDPPAEWSVSTTLVQAVLKGDKMDEVVRDAVMLGVTAVQPIVTKRTEVTVAALLRSAKVDRWRRVALASVKQSRRAVLPEIRTPLTLETYVDEPPPAVRLMLVEPGTSANVESLAVLRRSSIPQDAAVIVGPEGGWPDEEWRMASSRGARLISLGKRMLRADAVPVAALSVLQFLWDEADG
jgi:16S rRNA (uracil1498-N3)-methyltransferase